MAKRKQNNGVNLNKKNRLIEIDVSYAQLRCKYRFNEMHSNRQTGLRGRIIQVHRV